MQKIRIKTLNKLLQSGFEEDGSAGWTHTSSGSFFAIEMLPFCGQTVAVARVTDDDQYIWETIHPVSRWLFCDAMIDKEPPIKRNLPDWF